MHRKQVAHARVRQPRVGLAGVPSKRSLKNFTQARNDFPLERSFVCSPGEWPDPRRAGQSFFATRSRFPRKSATPVEIERATSS